MKLFFTLFFTGLFCFSSAQVTISIGGGVTSKATLASDIEIGYQLKKMQISAGYLVCVTDDNTVPDLFFIKGARKIQCTKKSFLSIGGGFALARYMEMETSKIDQQYSFGKTVYAGKPLLYLDYQKQVMSDGAFHMQTMYSGGIFYAGVGLTYLFKKKK